MTHLQNQLVPIMRPFVLLLLSSQGPNRISCALKWLTGCGQMGTASYAFWKGIANLSRTAEHAWQALRGASHCKESGAGSFHTRPPPTPPPPPQKSLEKDSGAPFFGDFSAMGLGFEGSRSHLPQGMCADARSC